MKELADLIDAIKLNGFPTSYSEEERKLTTALVDMAKQQARPYSGDFHAPWLLSDFEASSWKTTNRRREEFIDGKWENVYAVNWDILLPNGAYLTDSKYANLLLIVKKIAFFSRSGFLGLNPSVPYWKGVVNTLLNLARWTVLHERRYCPADYAFALLDQTGLNSLFASFAFGGWVEVFQIPHRLVSYWHEQAFGSPILEDILLDPYNLPVETTRGLSKWLRENEYFVLVEDGSYKGKEYLCRKKSARDVSDWPQRLVASNRMELFCRQFEDDFLQTPLFVGIRQNTEFPSHKTLTLDEVKSQQHSEPSLESVAHLMKLVFSAHRHLEEWLPNPRTLSVTEAANINQANTRPPGHNKFIPIDVGLSYLKNATTIVHEFGHEIVECYLIVAKQIYPMLSKRHGDSGLSLRNATVELSQYESVLPVDSVVKLKRLGISLVHRPFGTGSFDLLRAAPTLAEALLVFVGACIGCIGMMKTSREAELTHLNRKCTEHSDGGYRVQFQLGKSNVGEMYNSISRPIPFITAKAIQLLQHLGSSLALMYQDNRKWAQYLFYLPILEGTGARKPTPTLLSDHLDLFCDYVGLPTDELGRRWYLRVHEMRKWFLLLLFWSGRYDTLEAARYLAGHADVSHTYAYIEGEIPGSELPRLEAEYAIDRLFALDSKSPDSTHDAGLDALYREVLDHFKVQSLSLIPEPDWGSYVTMLREEEKFHLEPHSIYSDDGQHVIGINVSFVLRQDAT